MSESSFEQKGNKQEFPEDVELVLLPGLDGTGKLFGPLVEAFGQGAGFKVIRYPVEERLSYEALAKYVEARLTPDRDYVLLGESFSGPVAALVTSRAGKNLRGVIFCVTFASSPRPLLLQLVHLLPLALLCRRPSAPQIMRPNLRLKHVPERLTRLFEEVRAEVPPAVFADRLKLVSRVNVTGLLGQIAAPCCYLQAQSDRVVPGRCLRVFEREIADLVIRKVAGPHVILQAHPSICAELIANFTEKCCRS